jgi:hypothetical protein
MRTKLLLAAALLSIGTASASPPPDTPTDPETTKPDTKKVVPTEPGQRSADESLSDKLDRSHGVLHPGDTPDASVHKPAMPPNSDRDVIVPPTEKTPAVNPK